MTHEVRSGVAGFEVWAIHADASQSKCVVITPTESWASAVARGLNIDEAARR